MCYCPVFPAIGALLALIAIALNRRIKWVSGFTLAVALFVTWSQLSGAIHLARGKKAAAEQRIRELKSTNAPVPSPTDNPPPTKE